MAVDPLSPIAPARIRALLLPVGRIKRSRFLAFVDLLQPQCMIRLGDISPDPRPDRNMFSPLACPSGTLLYDLSTSLPPPSHLSLSPFELFREPLLVIGIGDAAEYDWLNESRAQKEFSTDHQHPGTTDQDTAEIRSSLEDIREQYPKAYLHTLMMFDCHSQGAHPQLPRETVLVPNAGQLKTTTIKTIVCDMTSKLLAEMTTLARSIQALPTVLSPASHQSDSTNHPPAWAMSESNVSMGRRNSQVTTGSRSESPGSGGNKELHRMSMPVLPSTGSGGPLSIEDPRALPSTRQGVNTPPTTFDEIPGVNATSTLTRNNSNPKPSATNAREASADRVSIHGFGSGGVGERARNKGRGRISIIIGTLYMSAGLWHDALRELTEGANRARALSDHLWHAKALENILVCLLLFAWSGLDFQIPQICYPVTDKPSGTKSPQHTPSSSVADISSPTPPALSSHDVALDALNSLLPDLVNMILNIYARASNFAGESLPPLAFSECVIRFSKLLAAMNLSAGFLDNDALQHLVQHTPLRQKPRLSVPRLSVNPTRNDIATMIFRALPAQSGAGEINPTDRVVVLAGIASVLSALGLHRKKAIVMKEFITSLIPGLVQARKVGAAEMGVHPAAGLAALNMTGGATSGAGPLNLGEGEIENGIDEFLGLLGKIYGIPGSRGTLPNSQPPATKQPGSKGSSNAENSQIAVEEILQTSSLRSFGSLTLKIDILRMCINFCEALPDFNGVLHFTALLLRIAGPGTAPKPNSTDVFVSLPRDEQARLFANISRTVAAANKLGLRHIETEYWDDFLVRGIVLVEEPLPFRLTHHRPAELELASSGKDGPFIHNPWLKRPTSDIAETILVANRQYRFVIALQNPYDFELEVESLRIAGDGVDFVAHEELFLLGPYRTQRFDVVGVARSAGTLKINGCYIKVAGCRERLFPLFPEPWKPEREPKMKKIGLTACVGAPISRPASAVEPAIEPLSLAAPKPETLAFTVIPDQPVVTVTDVSLPQGAVMVLEGEKKRFTVTLKNTSQTTAVDFIHVTFQDSASATIQAATSNRELPATELHELEVQLAHYPSLRWCKAEDEEPMVIKPGESATFEVEVMGRTRLTDAIIQFDYANLGKRKSEVQDRFFTRQLTVPISITVNASVQLQRPDIVSLSGDFAWSSQQGRAKAGASVTPSSIILNKNDCHFQEFIRLTSTKSGSDEYCMLLLDLRNSWPNPLSISLEIRPDPSTHWDKAYTVRETIQPGHVSRIVLILPRIYLTNPFAPIPSLNPANQRQFVVSTSKIAPETERATREAFWYRQALLDLIRGSWTEEIETSNGGNVVGAGSRHGTIDLRSIRFSPRMVDAIKLDDVSITMSILPQSDPASSTLLDQLGAHKYAIQTNTFLTLRTEIHNRSSAPISPLLRLQPHLSGFPHTIGLDLDKRFSWTGVLQRKLPVVIPGGKVEAELGIVALCKGVFEIGAFVEEVEVLNGDSGRGEGGRGGGKGRPRSGTQVLQDKVLGERRLRSWGVKENLVLVAKRGDEVAE